MASGQHPMTLAQTDPATLVRPALCTPHASASPCRCLSPAPTLVFCNFPHPRCVAPRGRRDRRNVEQVCAVCPCSRFPVFVGCTAAGRLRRGRAGPGRWHCCICVGSDRSGSSVTSLAVSWKHCIWQWAGADRCQCRRWPWGRTRSQATQPRGTSCKSCTVLPQAVLDSPCPSAALQSLGAHLGDFSEAVGIADAPMGRVASPSCNVHFVNIDDLGGGLSLARCPALHVTVLAVCASLHTCTLTRLCFGSC